MSIEGLKISRRHLALVLGFLAMLGPFAIDSIFPAFRALANDLHVADAAIQQTISIYLLGYAAMSLLHGALSDAYGRKPVVLLGLALFMAASIGCALATNLQQLLVFRFLQGLCAGVGLIVGRAVIRDVFQGDDAQRMMSMVSMVFSIAPAIAPIIGGYILSWSHWQGIFWFLASLTLLMLLVVAWFLPESHPPSRRVAFHPVTLGISYQQMLRNTAFRRLALAGSFLFGSLFLYIAAAPDYVMTHLALDETQFGWFFVPTIAGMSLGAFSSARLAGKVSGLKLVRWGYAICAVSIVLNLWYANSAQRLELPWAVLPMSGLAFGIALVFPVLTIALLDLYPQIRGTASSLQAFLSLLVNAVISGVLVPLLSKSPPLMAGGCALFVVSSYGAWRLYLQAPHAPLHCPDQPAAFEPTDEM